MGEFSQVVADGMKKVCSDFTRIVQPFGFRRGKRRSWVRESGEVEEAIYISRSGSSYGAPYSPSISLQIDLSSTKGIEGPRQYLDHHTIGLMRRPTGNCFHHRFNAATGSTYDRCIEELDLFMSEVAEPWFVQQR